MARVKRGIISMKRRRRVLKAAKGYRFGRSTKEREARVAILHAGQHAYRHRRTKKRDFRRLWQVRINAAGRQAGLPYSRLINQLKKKGVIIDRKILATLAQKTPDIFTRLIQAIK